MWSVPSPRETHQHSSPQAGDVPPGKVFCNFLPLRPSSVLLSTDTDTQHFSFQAPQSECPSDSEATPEGAVRGQSGSAGEEEQSVLQVHSRTTVLFLFLSILKVEYEIQWKQVFNSIQATEDMRV